MAEKSANHYNLFRKWRNKVRLIDIGLGIRSCVLVAGTARSGTTWIGNVIAQATHSRQIFEPFLQTGTLNFALRSSRRPAFDHYQPYVRATSPGGDWHDEIDRILRGKIRHWWCDRFNSPRVYRRRVIKAVRMNLMLDYLCAHWPRLKLVYVVRDPLNVVNSQIAKIKQNWVMQWKPDYALSQPQLMEDWLEPFRGLLESADTLAQQQAVKWCIENLAPLTCLRQRQNALIVEYDRLVQDPSTSWSEVAAFLTDRNWRETRFRQVVDRVSPTAERSPQQIAQRIEPLAELTSNDEQTIIETVHAFGLPEFIRSRNPGQRAA